MDQISDIVIEPLSSSPYIQPSRVNYKQNGKQLIWDAMKVHDGVAVLIYNKSRNVFVFVKQFRPAIYITSAEITRDADGKATVDTTKYPGSLGITYELCSGIVDKNLSLVEIARLEVLEECGYDVPVDSLEKVTSFKSGVGTSGALLTLFYVEVTDQQKVSEGGGNPEEGELIEVVDVPVSESQKYALDENINRPATFSLALLWFEQYKR